MIFVKFRISSKLNKLFLKIEFKFDFGEKDRIRRIRVQVQSPDCNELFIVKCRCALLVAHCSFFFFLVAYLSSNHEKAINALYELALELPAICLPHQVGGIPAKCLYQ